MSEIDRYVPAYRSALEMAAALSATLQGDRASETYAVDRLCEAVDRLNPFEGHSDRQGFSSERTEPLSKSPQSVDLNLRLAAADAQLVIVMVEASRAVGEQASPGDGAVLRRAVDTAVLQLDSLERASDRLGFAGGPELPPSPDLAQAAARFREQSNAVFGLVADECEQTISAAVQAIRENADKVLEVLGTVGDLLADAAPRIPLLKRAWDCLLSCLDHVRAAVKGIPVAELKTLLASTIGDISIRSAVDRILGTAAARTEIDAFRLGAPLTIKDLDDGSIDVMALGPRFSSIAASGRIVLGVLTVSAGTIAAQVGGPAGAAIVPAVYGLVVAGLLAIALDFTDRGMYVNAVSGVLQIGHALDSRTAMAHGV